MSAAPPIAGPDRARRPGRRRTLAVAVLGATLAAGLLAVPAPAAVAARAGAATLGAGPAAVADDGARVIAETVVDARTVDLTIQSPALGGTTRARLLLPRDWASRPTWRWPTLYLLHGANEPQDYRSWTAFTDVAAFTADKNALLVLPSDGPAGFYTDTYNPLWLPNSLAPRWETYHTVELPQIIQRGYRSNGHNAVAGLSIGGYGALIYAARHPGLYRAAASYSGLTNIFDFSALVAVTNSRLQAGQVFSPWGSAILNHGNWVAHNPIDQAAKLRGTALYVSAGDGTPGPLDDPNFKDLAGSRTIEQFTGSMNRAFVDRLHVLGVPVTANLYRGGYHYWNYWQREFHASWPVLSAAMGEPTVATVTAASSNQATGSSPWWNAIFGG